MSKHELRVGICCCEMKGKRRRNGKRKGERRGNGEGERNEDKLKRVDRKMESRAAIAQKGSRSGKEQEGMMIFELAINEYKIIKVRNQERGGG